MCICFHSCVMKESRPCLKHKSHFFCFYCISRFVFEKYFEFEIHSHKRRWTFMRTKIFNEHIKFIDKPVINLQPFESISMWKLKKKVEANTHLHAHTLKILLWNEYELEVKYQKYAIEYGDRWYYWIASSPKKNSSISIWFDCKLSYSYSC